MYLLNEENQVLCPFCDEQLEEIKSIEPQCCDHPNITIDVFKEVCTNTPIEGKTGSCMEARPKGPSAFATPGGKNGWVVEKVSRSSK